MFSIHWFFFILNECFRNGELFYESPGSKLCLKLESDWKINVVLVGFLVQ